MRAPDVEHRTVESFDGTRIAYQVRGDGPAIVLANGLGGTYSAWRHQYALFGAEYKVICWDYRGLFRSARPPRLDSVALPEQARDLEHVLRAEEVERAVFIGWSMGVQYNFEYHREHAEQFVGMVALNGVPRRPFDTLQGLPGLFRPAVPVALEAMQRGAGLVGTLTGIVSQWRALIPLLQTVGMVGRTLDQDVFHDLATEFSGIDFETYAETLRRLGQHDASDVLEQVRVPALVVAGSDDFFTPISTATAMVQALPDARLAVIEGGTHYAAVEYPEAVNAELRRFLRQLDW